MFYTVVEVQVSAQGAKGILTSAFDSREQALAKLYTVLAAASVSTIPYHAAWMLNSSGAVEEVKVFERGKE